MGPVLSPSGSANEIVRFPDGVPAEGRGAGKGVGVGAGAVTPVPLRKIVCGTQPRAQPRVVIVAVPVLEPTAMGAKTIVRLQLEFDPRVPLIGQVVPGPMWKSRVFTAMLMSINTLLELLSGIVCGALAVPTA